MGQHGGCRVRGNEKLDGGRTFVERKLGEGGEESIAVKRGAVISAINGMQRGNEEGKER